MTDHTVQAIKSKDGSQVSCRLRLPGRGREGGLPACEIEVVLDQKVWARSAADYFAALALIRLDLEAEGWLLVCYGASRNVYPSGMARDMGLGLKAYKLRLGQHARPEDLVNIFTTGPDVDPASVDDQKAFFEKWAASERR